MGVDEDDDYEQGVPDVDEENFIRTKAKYQDQEVELRRKAFVKILNQVGVSLEPTQKVQSHREQDENLNLCVTKFDKDELKFRRAFSFDGDSCGSWVAEGSDEEDNKDQTMAEESSEA